MPGALPRLDASEPDAVAARLSGGVARGNADAFEALYRAWTGRVFALARAATGRDEAFCLDVVQDVMLRAARSLKALPTHGALCGWFSRTTLSVCVDAMRSEQRRERRHAEHGRRGQSDRPVGDREDAWLVSMVRDLPQLDFELLVTRVAHERSLREAGLSAGISEDAAHGRLRRLIHRLRALARGGES